jgi:hypothetical protein
MNICNKCSKVVILVNDGLPNINLDLWEWGYESRLCIYNRIDLSMNEIKGRAADRLKRAFADMPVSSLHMLIC